MSNLFDAYYRLSASESSSAERLPMQQFMAVENSGGPSAGNALTNNQLAKGGYDDKVSAFFAALDLMQDNGLFSSEINEPWKFWESVLGSLRPQNPSSFLSVRVTEDFYHHASRARCWEGPLETIGFRVLGNATRNPNDAQVYIKEMAPAKKAVNDAYEYISNRSSVTFLPSMRRYLVKQGLLELSNGTEEVYTEKDVAEAREKTIWFLKSGRNAKFTESFATLVSLVISRSELGRARQYVETSALYQSAQLQQSGVSYANTSLALSKEMEVIVDEFAASSINPDTGIVSVRSSHLV